MKRTKKVFTSFVFACLGISAVALCVSNIKANKITNVTFASTVDRTGTPKTSYLIGGDEAEYIDFLTGFNGGVNNADFARFRNDTFWNTKMRYFGMDYFCDTFKGGGDDWTGTFTSREFLQNGKPYVCFQFGGFHSDATNYCQLQRYDEGTSGWVDLGDKIYNKDVNDPLNCQQLILRVVEIPSEYRSAKLRAQFVDGTTGGFGGMTFGAFTGACSLDSAAKLFNLYKLALTDVVLDGSEHSDTATNAASSAYISARLNSWAEYSDVRTRAAELGEVNNISDGFETVEGFPTFTEDYLFSDNDVDGGHFNVFTNSFRSNLSVAEWALNSNFNKTGDYFLAPEMNARGEAQHEAYRARFFSSPFILRGSGYISIKMSGRSAKFTVWDADTYQELFSINDDNGNRDQRIFIDEHVEADGDSWSVKNVTKNGCRLHTMTRVYVDLTDLIGHKLFVSLEDYRTGGGWGLAWFDEFVSYYHDVPTIGFDVFSQTHDEVTGYAVCRDLLVRGQENAFTAAWNFLENTYFPTVRNTAAGTFCTGTDTFDSGIKDTLQPLRLPKVLKRLLDQLQIINILDMAQKLICIPHQLLLVIQLVKL